MRKRDTLGCDQTSRTVRHDDRWYQLEINDYLKIDTTDIPASSSSLGPLCFRDVYPHAGYLFGKGGVVLSPEK
jgi:hypothetical protein